MYLYRKRRSWPIEFPHKGDACGGQWDWTKFKRLLFGLGERYGRSATARRQTGFPMMLKAPGIHGRQNSIRLMNGKSGAFSDDF